MIKKIMLTDGSYLLLTEDEFKRAVRRGKADRKIKAFRKRRARIIGMGRIDRELPGTATNYV